MKSKKVLISLREDFLSTIDMVAETECRSRSELIREALRVYINKRNPLPNVETGNEENSGDLFSTVNLR